MTPARATTMSAVVGVAAGVGAAALLGAVATARPLEATGTAAALSEELAQLRHEAATLRASAAARRDAPVPPPPFAGEDATRSRVAELQRELAELRARFAPFQGMDPVAAIVHSTTALRDKLRAITRLAEKDRWRATWTLGSECGGDAERAAAVLAALKAEADSELLALLGGVIRGGGLGDLSPEVWSEVLEILGHGQPAARRAAAAWALAGRGSRQQPDGYIEAVENSLRQESSPDVLAALGSVFAAWPLTVAPGSLRDAFAAAARRMPAGQGRRDVFAALGRAGLFAVGNEGGADLWPLWSAAETSDERTDIAAGMSRVANSGGTNPLAAGLPADRGAAGTELKRRFLAVYAGADDVAVRQYLVRGAQHGFVLLPLWQDNAAAAAFVREIAAAEPDAAQRVRLEAFAKAIEAGEIRGSDDADRIVTGGR